MKLKRSGVSSDDFDPEVAFIGDEIDDNFSTIFCRENFEDCNRMIGRGQRLDQRSQMKQVAAVKMIFRFHFFIFLNFLKESNFLFDFFLKFRNSFDAIRDFQVVHEIISQL